MMSDDAENLWSVVFTRFGQSGNLQFNFRERQHAVEVYEILSKAKRPQIGGVLDPLEVVDDFGVRCDVDRREIGHVILSSAGTDLSVQAIQQKIQARAQKKLRQDLIVEHGNSVPFLMPGGPQGGMPN